MKAYKINFNGPQNPFKMVEMVPCTDVNDHEKLANWWYQAWYHQFANWGVSWVGNYCQVQKCPTKGHLFCGNNTIRIIHSWEHIYFHTFRPLVSCARKFYDFNISTISDLWSVVGKFYDFNISTISDLWSVVGKFYDFNFTVSLS